MAEETLTQNTSGEFQKIQDESPITINAQYIKDLSFETPTAPGIFSLIQQTAPDVHVDVNVTSNEFQAGVYEVVLSLSARCNVGDDTAFIAELEYAGLFTLNVEEEVKSAILMVECPRLLFPFARKILAETSREGGFPPVMLGVIDFARLYQSQIHQSSNDSTE